MYSKLEYEIDRNKKPWKVIMGKRKLNIALLFGILMSSLLGNAFAASPAYNFYPLYFPYVTKSDSAKQLPEWEYLMKYKIYGQEGIEFEDGNINIPDETGWFGTSTGGWSMNNAGHRIGGPILIGGGITFGTGSDRIITGPMRVLGNINAGVNFNNNEINGPVCVPDSVNVPAKFANFVDPENRYFKATNEFSAKGYSNCPDSIVPEVKQNLTVPRVDASDLPGYGAKIIYNCNNPNALPNGALCIDNATGYIDVPPSDKTSEEERDADVYDLHVSSFFMLNKSRLIVRMPSTGRLTRVFIDDSIKVNSNARIKIVYMSDNKKYAEYDTDSLKWIMKPDANGNYDSSYRAIQNNQYTGNLLFHAKKNFTFDALNSTDSLQGTFISEGTIHVLQQMTLAGQLIAKKLIIRANFDGSGFIFVPFNPPKIDPGALARGQYEENNKLVAIDVTLDKTPETDVRFNYCFRTKGTMDASGAKYADPEDIKDSVVNMPRCGATSGSSIDSVWIHAGETSPRATDSIYLPLLRVAKDDSVEGDEWLEICISNLSGAIVKGNYPTDIGYGICLPLRIKDANNHTPELKDNTSLSVTENIAGDKAGVIKAEDEDNDHLTLKIVGGTGKDLFEISQDGTLSLKPDSSVDYEAHQSYTVKVSVTDGKIPTAVTKTYVVNVQDVNESPVAKNATFSVKENSVGGTFVGLLKWTDPDTKKDFYKNDVSIAIDGDTTLFEIDTDGMITVKENALIDYEVKKVHTLKVKVVDSSKTELYDEAEVTINVIDEDDGPKIVIPPGPENDSTKHILVLKNGKQRGVKENNPENALAGKVSATCSSTDCMNRLTFSMPKDTSNLFEISPTTGEITVKDSMVLDFEKVNVYAVTVVVCDNNPAGPQYYLYDTATVIINVIDVDEAPSIAQGTFYVDEKVPVKTSFGKLDSLTSDLDTAAMFIQHKFVAIGGDTAQFAVKSDGTIQNRVVLKYNEDSIYTIKVMVIDKADTSLTDTATMTIRVNDVNDNPYFTSEDSYEFPENPKKGYVIGQLTAEDEDQNDSTFTYKLKSNVDYVTVSKDGVMKVKDSTAFDYEKAHSLSFVVTVFDEHGGSSDTLITVKITDVNEPVTLPPQTFTVSEDEKIGTTIGTIIANDLDTAEQFTRHTFKLLTKTVGFEVLTDGTIKLIDSLDYELDSIYVLKVSVTDGEFSDTNDITIKVKDVDEWSKVVITRGETPDSVWLMPDTIYTNRYSIDLEWTEDGTTRYGTEKLTDGKNIIIKKFKDPKKNHGGADTVIIYVNSDSPEVTVSTKDKEVKASNIFTVVQEKDEGDTAYYVNSKKNEVFVSVKDPGSSKRDTFTVKLELDSVTISSVTFTKTMGKIVDANLTLDRNATENKKVLQVNGEVMEVSYTEIVNGTPVTVTYYTDFKGDLIKGESGKKEIKVSYTLAVGGKDVTISYRADASTGKLVEGPNGSTYTVSYDYVDANDNSINITYDVDEKGAFAKDSDGNAGFYVSYSYTNKYGNTSNRSLYMVLDKAPPKVEILYPTDGEVLHSNFVDVKWTVDGVVQDTLVTQGLQKGTNAIVRYYRDKAGNTDSAVVIVVVKGIKDVEISVEKPVTVIDEDKVAKYYGSNPPKKGENYAVSIYNARKGVEQEVLVGGDMKTKKGSGKEPYPGLKGHLGPTLLIDAKLPVVNAVHGLATLDDLVNSDGIIAVDGVDAKKSRKMSVDEYVHEYCTAEFVQSMPSDISKANLYITTMVIDVWIFTNLGQYVDKFTFSLDLDDPDYVDESGMLTMAMELKPDVNGNLKTKDGKLLATGAYVYKTEVNLHSTLRCTLPPVDDSDSSGKIGSRRRVSEELLKPFGYKRPVTNKE
jgi:hypothetical protein